MLFIDTDAKKDKINRLSTYKEIKTIYPNAEIYFNTDYNFKAKKNEILDKNTKLF